MVFGTTPCRAVVMHLQPAPARRYNAAPKKVYTAPTAADLALMRQCGSGLAGFGGEKREVADITAQLKVMTAEELR